MAGARVQKSSISGVQWGKAARLDKAFAAFLFMLLKGRSSSITKVFLSSLGMLGFKEKA